jgi:hypothetical protein
MIAKSSPVLATIVQLTSMPDPPLAAPFLSFAGHLHPPGPDCPANINIKGR